MRRSSSSGCPGCPSHAPARGFEQVFAQDDAARAQALRKARPDAGGDELPAHAAVGIHQQPVAEQRRPAELGHERPAELLEGVGQDDQLFMGTLRENLVLSDSWISDALVMNVLKQLGMYEVVASHPRGMDMPLTEAGGGLSGGQRQMLAIARMMLREPSIVFMDEPTSHMDQNSEARVIEVMSTWLKGRTLVLATHRPQLLTLVDTIAVLERGVVVTQGPRDEILEQLSKGVNTQHAEQVKA